MDFKNANELLALCEEKNLPVSEIMRIREIELGETDAEVVNQKMTRVLEIMKDAALSPISQPVTSMGGLIGGTDDLKKVLTATVESCTNYGNVFTHIGCRTGGFIGHSNIRIIGCANQGAILGDVYNSDHGPAWACGYSGQSSGEWVNVSSCTMGGYVGSYTTYKDNPTSAPAATVHNAFSYKNDEYYDPTINN